jgi:Glyoxalase/Bleomycin resistance protein/Dioxygenase superfamily
VTHWATREPYEPAGKVASVDSAVEVFRAHGCIVVSEPADIPVGKVAVVEDPFGNRLLLLDLSKGRHQTDSESRVTGVG